MPVEPLFPTSYVGGGKFALLCEGDRIGAEKSFLDLWVREKNLEINVWPCGTKDGLFAMADALGRTVKVLVVEDLDFRDPAGAAQECLIKRKGREKREVAMHGWMAWTRNEFENYFLDEEVLVPALSRQFGCSAQEVLARFEQAIELLLPFQALQATKAQIRQRWSASDPSCWGMAAKPQWTEAGLRAVSPDAVRNDLIKQFQGWKQEREPEQGLAEMQCEQAEEYFCAKLAEWAKAARNSPAVVTAWAGKEVIHVIYQHLAASFPTPVMGPGGERRIPPTAWVKLNANARSRLTREIERAILPGLVAQLWEFTEAHAQSAMAIDLCRIVDPVEAA